ncbi:MAG: abortive infection family protein [Acidimicrobiales bacterium]
MAIGVAKLRNEYGPDHGRSRPTRGLGARHAHLAVGCAATYCRMLLETLSARSAADGSNSGGLGASPPAVPARS